MDRLKFKPELLLVNVVYNAKSVKVLHEMAKFSDKGNYLLGLT